MNSIWSYKNSNSVLWKNILRKSISATATRFLQQPTYLTAREISHQHLPTIRIHAQSLSELNNFSLCMKRCTTTIKPKILHPIQQSLQFILFCIHNMVFYQIVPRTSKRMFFKDIVHFIDEENIVTFVDFDCGSNFYPGTHTKNGQTNRERKEVFRSCKKLNCIPSNEQHNCSIDEQHTSKIFLNSYNLWDMVPATLMSLSHTNDT